MEKTLIENLEAAKKPDAPEWNAALEEAIAIVRQQPSYWLSREERTEITERLPATLLGREMSPLDMLTDIYHELANHYLIAPRERSGH